MSYFDEKAGNEHEGGQQVEVLAAQVEGPILDLERAQANRNNDGHHPKGRQHPSGRRLHYVVDHPTVSTTPRA